MEAVPQFLQVTTHDTLAWEYSSDRGGEEAAAYSASKTLLPRECCGKLTAAFNTGALREGTLQDLRESSLAISGGRSSQSTASP